MRTTLRSFALTTAVVFGMAAAAQNIVTVTGSVSPYGASLPVSPRLDRAATRVSRLSRFAAAALISPQSKRIATDPTPWKIACTACPGFT